MVTNAEDELIRLETYTHREDAAKARKFLQSWGIAGVVVIDKSINNLSKGGRKDVKYVYDLCVPEPDVAKAFNLMEREGARRDLRRGSFHEEIPA